MVCLRVDLSYPGAPGEVSRAPVAEQITAALEHLGLVVQRGDEAGCDAVLDVRLDFRAVGAEYAQVPQAAGQTCYTGAEASGESRLEVAGGTPLSLPLAASREPARIISECAAETEAPLDQVWAEPVAAIVGEWWGIAGLVSAMEVGDGSVAFAAGQRLGAMGADAAAAIAALREGIGGADWVDLLAAGEEQSDEEMRRAAMAFALVRISPESATEAAAALAAALADADRDTRLAIIRGLGVAGVHSPELAIPALVDALTGDPDPFLREEAARTLGRIGSAAAAAVPDLIAIAGQGGAVAQEAATALGLIADETAIPALVAAAERGEGWALDVLETMGPAAVTGVPALIALLAGEENWRVTSALSAITGQSLGSDPEDWRVWLASRECATVAAPPRVAVPGSGGQITIEVLEAGPIGREVRPCDTFYAGCVPDDPVTAAGVFYGVRYTVQNTTSEGSDPSRDWWLTDGVHSWPRFSSVRGDVSAGWAYSQGDVDDHFAGPGEAITTWAVFDIPEDATPTAIGWSLADGEQACLGLP
jgi:HEAT repeat protein